MSKLSLDDLEKYNDDESLVRFKKKPKTNKKKREKVDKRKNYVDLSEVV